MFAWMKVMTTILACAATCGAGSFFCVQLNWKITKTIC